MVINPTTGNLNQIDNNPTSEVWITFFPSEPNGDNGWYVTYVNIYFYTNNGTEIKDIYFRIGPVPWQELTSSQLYWEGNLTYHFLVIDTEENQWYFGPYHIKIDVTPPKIKGVEWETYKEHGCWLCDFTCNATDPPNLWDGPCSGMDRVEMFIEDGINEIIKGHGPIYTFISNFQDVMRYMIYFYYYDNAGNVISNSVDGNNITSYPYNQNNNMFFFRLIDRFPILQMILDVLRLNIR